MKSLQRLFLLLSFLILSIKAETTLLAASRTLRVPQEFLTIQSAINAAVSGDTILVATGTYQESLVFDKSGVTLSGTNRQSIIQGVSTTFVISCKNLTGTKAVIQGFKITGGHGGIHCASTVRDLQIHNNLITQNVSELSGYGILLGGGSSVEITSNTISANGQGITAGLNNIVNIVDNQIIGNRGGGGWGILISRGQCFIARNTIAASWDGAIKLYENTNAVLVKNVLTNNDSWDVPAGFSIENSTAVLWQNLVAFGKVYRNGDTAGLSAVNSHIELYNNVFHGLTFLNDSLRAGAAMSLLSSDVVAKNNIFTSNGSTGAPNVVNNMGTKPYDFSYNDFWDNKSVGNVGGITLGVGNKFENPLYVNTINFALGAGSPCINAGDPDPKFNDANGTRNDMGIYGGVYGRVITPSPSPQTLRVPQDFSTIQAAINASLSGDTIEVATGTYSETLLFNKSGVVLQGTNRQSVIVGVSTSHPVIFCDRISGAESVIRGFKITQGKFGIRCSSAVASLRIENNLITENLTAKLGYGIYLNVNSSVKITGNTISYNGQGVAGAGNNVVEIVSNQLAYNRASYTGGGILISRGQCLIQGNTITSSWDGAIRLTNNTRAVLIKNVLKSNNSWGTAAGMLITNSTATLWQNLLAFGTVVSNGNTTAGIHASSSTVEMYNNIFHRLTFSTDTARPGAAMYLSNSKVIAKNNIITSNGSTGSPNVIYAIGTGTKTFSYNDFYNNKSSSNSNGIVLGVGNKFQDPLYQDIVNFALGLGSPCIDAGDPNPQFNDLNGTRNDMGIYGGVYRAIINNLPAVFGAAFLAEIRQPGGVVRTTNTVSNLNMGLTDPDGDLLTVTVENGPSFVSTYYDSLTNSHYLRIDTRSGVTGHFNGIVVKVNDGVNVSSQSFNLFVHLRPSVTGPLEVSGRALEPIQFQVYSHDPEDGSNIFLTTTTSFVQLGGARFSVLGSTGTFYWVPSSTQVGVYQADFIAFDQNGASQTWRTKVTVLDPAPVARTLRVPQEYPTIQAAINAAVSGDTIQVATGTYQEANLIFNKSGVVLQGTNQQSVIQGVFGSTAILCNNLIGAKSVIKGFKITRGSYGIRCSSTVINLRIENNLITQNYSNTSGYGIYLDQGSSIEIVTNTISLNGKGIYGVGNNIVEIVANQILSNKASYGGGIILSGAQCLIKGNTITNSWDGAIQLSANTRAVLVKNVLTNNNSWNQPAGFSITNSTAILWQNLLALGTVHQYGSTAGLYASNSHVELYNNIFHGLTFSFGSTRAGAAMNLSNTSVIAKNNIITSNGSAGGSNVVNYTGTKSRDFSYNDFWDNKTIGQVGGITLGVGNKFENPLYVNTTSFGLGVGSPCINAGDPDPQFNDPDGTRNDMGIYGGPQNPSITSSLSVSQSLSSSFSAEPHSTYINGNNTPISLADNNQQTLNQPQQFKNKFNPIRGEFGGITFTVGSESHVGITLYDRFGRVVKELTSRDFPPGRFTEAWDGRDGEGFVVASGVYHVVMKIGNQTNRSKIIVSK